MLEEKPSLNAPVEWVKQIPLFEEEGENIREHGEVLGVSYALLQRPKSDQLDLIIDRRIVMRTSAYRFDMMGDYLSHIKKVGRIPKSSAELRQIEDESFDLHRQTESLAKEKAVFNKIAGDMKSESKELLRKLLDEEGKGDLLDE